MNTTLAFSRRDLIQKIGAAAGVAAFVPRAVLAQQAAPRVAPSTVISNPPRHGSAAPSNVRAGSAPEPTNCEPPSALETCW